MEWIQCWKKLFWHNQISCLAFAVIGHVVQLILSHFASDFFFVHIVRDNKNLLGFSFIFLC